MLAKVERNEYYNKNFFCKDEYTRESLDKGLHYRWEAFEELRGYAHTKYYQEVIAECGYFKRFVELDTPINYEKISGTYWCRYQCGKWH